MASNTQRHKFFPMKIAAFTEIGLRIIVMGNYGGKSLVIIKCHNLDSFKEEVILLCQCILETRRMSYLDRWLSSLYNTLVLLC